MQAVRALIVAMLLVACSGESEPETAAVELAEPVPTQAAEELSEESAAIAGPDIEVGTVLLTINGVETAGSGVAFLMGSEVHARLFVGSPLEYLQFDLIGDPANSPIALEPGQQQPSTIFGGDAAAFDYTSIGEPDANTYTLVRTDDGSVHGTLDFTLLHWDGTRREMTGGFRLAASESTDWDCDWSGDLVTDCDFIAE